MNITDTLNWAQQSPARRPLEGQGYHPKAPSREHGQKINCPKKTPKYLKQQQLPSYSLSRRQTLKGQN
jgi:hypothetical protein